MLLTPNNLKFVKLELKGIEEYLSNIQKAGGNVDEVVTQALKESAKPIHDDIQKWAVKHKLTGSTEEGVAMSEVKQDGNTFSVDIGLDSNKSAYSWHGVFVEYGTPTQPADPGLRTAFDNNKSKIKKIQRDVLAKGGIPV
jgi:HK97 gp10 family phage protein